MESRFKIAIVGGSLSTYGGGAPRSMAQQATVLTEQGHHVELFVGFSRKYPLTQEQFSCRETPVNASVLWGPSVLGLFPRALFKLWKRAGEFDFIHLNGAWNLTTVLGALIARSRKTPYIITMRGHFGEYHFRRMPSLKKLIFRIFEKTNIRHACAMHATAQWEVETSAMALQYARQVIVIPNPVDLTDFRNPPLRQEARQKLGLSDKDFHIVHLGRLAKQKNLPFLIDVFAQANLGSDSFLTFIGPPEPDLKCELLNQVDALQIKDRVRFIDFAKGKERSNWLAAADLFALPSFDENFCIVAAESVACGTQTLLSPHVGVTEFLPAQLTHVAELDPKKWISALQQFKADALPQRIPDPADLSGFSTAKVYAEWMSFYHSQQRANSYEDQ
ncbi:glycosyltransferase family 4 protein [Pontiella agarivorans]|uniref:Glycosyltransferase family 4 protein n=1 Tax=Pontiella agarivorans TaxID=3038953 RepID=A0ABU5N046_9BACT|nr:glycosyltransferase family 4 protein [Pontiella agarivorans]MDZ8119825.1 glycosyltransferase family 4 protein [Pontiella agarivorans]